MSKLAFWDEADGPWDRLVLGKFQMPGAWTVSGECARDIDVKKSKGKDGARIQDQGYQNATITLRGTFWEREQWQQLQEILPELHPRKKGGERFVLPIVHPALSLVGVHKVYLKKISAPSIGGQGLEISIECLEWTPPKDVNKKKKGPAEGKTAAQLQAEANSRVGQSGGFYAGELLMDGLPIDRMDPNARLGTVADPATVARNHREFMEDKQKAIDAKRNSEMEKLMPPKGPTWYQKAWFAVTE